MKFERLEELKALLLMDEDETFDYCKEQLGPEEMTTMWMFKKGSPGTTLAVVAHLDTVGSPTKDELVHDRHVLRTAGNTPLGADDRAGIFGCLEVYRRAKVKPHVIFLCAEESGGKGARAFAADPKVAELLDGVHLLVELDRKGASDWVNYNGKFDGLLADYLDSFGYYEAHGSYSDVATICPVVKIPGVNLSIGYYSQHTANERLHLHEMYSTIDRVIEMTEDPPPQVEFKEYAYTRHQLGGGLASGSWWDRYGFGLDDYEPLPAKTGHLSVIGGKKSTVEEVEEEERTIDDLTDAECYDCWQLLNDAFDDELCPGECGRPYEECACETALYTLVGWCHPDELELLAVYLEDTPLGEQLSDYVESLNSVLLPTKGA